MWSCPKCGTNNDDSQKYCIYCQNQSYIAKVRPGGALAKLCAGDSRQGVYDILSPPKGRRRPMAVAVLSNLTLCMLFVAVALFGYVIGTNINNNSLDLTPKLNVVMDRCESFVQAHAFYLTEVKTYLSEDRTSRLRALPGQLLDNLLRLPQIHGDFGLPDKLENAQRLIGEVIK